MNDYKISFRILKSDKKQQITTSLQTALSISYKRAEALYSRAVTNADLRLNVTAEQLGDLQAMRLIEGLTDHIRYLYFVELLVEDEPEPLMEMRYGRRP